MTNKPEDKIAKRCFSSTISCILSTLIIVFITGAIIWDITVSKPQMKAAIDEIRTEVHSIDQKINSQHHLKTPRLDERTDMPQIDNMDHNSLDVPSEVTAETENKLKHE